jgi:hypothetical protein
MASTAHMSVSTTATTSSSLECGPISRRAIAAACTPMARPGHRWPWNATTLSSSALSSSGLLTGGPSTSLHMHPDFAAMGFLSSGAVLGVAPVLRDPPLTAF